MMCIEHFKSKSKANTATVIQSEEPTLLTDFFELKEFSVVNLGAMNRCTLHDVRSLQN